MSSDQSYCAIDLIRIVGGIAALLGLGTPVFGAVDSVDFFESRIRPVLVRACLNCHEGDDAENHLRLDSREAILKGGDHGPAIVPGDPEQSLIVQAIRRNRDDLIMPPEAALPDHEINDIMRWIKDGAIWPKSIELSNHDRHWAFQRRAKVDLPPSNAWSNHPVDRFIVQQWENHHLQPVEMASPRTRLRRLYFDLVGLPPSPERTEAFVRATQIHPEWAWEGEIDRLLASPHYGERWGRHWMDVVRYADTAGDNADYPIPEVRRYRDYIIDAFNVDRPFDQFAQEQLAGDLMAEHDPERYAELITATGFLALSRRYGTAPYEHWHLTLEDTIDTIGRAFLGLTFKCARCHDHKFDPITVEDYYGLYGIFASTQYPWAGGEELHSKKLPRQHFVPLEQRDELLSTYRQQLDEMSRQISDLEQQIETAKKNAAENVTPLEKKLGQLTIAHQSLNRPGIPHGLPAAYAVTDGTPQDVSIHISGNPATTGRSIARGAIHCFSGAPLQIPSDQSGRWQLAEWISDAHHPLTARVIVNRIWQNHFGQGLVATPSNFGNSGAPPSHPELLDYLANEFVRHGWSIKRIHRLILTSKTWQLSSKTVAQNGQVDPDNRLYWRHNRRRLDAEALRDALLMVAGQLANGRPGVHPFPPIEGWKWTQHRPFKERYKTPHRSVYLMTQRLQKHPFLGLFDGPDTNATTASRTAAIVTPQSLYLMNSPQVAALSEDFASTLETESQSIDATVTQAYQLCFSRPPTSHERDRGRRYLQQYESVAVATGQPTNQAQQSAWQSYAKILLTTNEFLYLD